MDASRRFQDVSRRTAAVGETQRSPDGGILVRTNDRGVPIAVKLDQRQLGKPPMQLARDILLLCQLSAKRMQAAQRRDLVARGVEPAVIRGLNLSSEEEVAQAEAQLRDNDGDDHTETWLGRI